MSSKKVILKLDEYRQVAVVQNQIFRVDRLNQELGSSIEYSICGSFENPFLKGTAICKVIEPEVKGKKIKVFYKTRRNGDDHMRGHRSKYTLLKVEELRMVA